jgi:solute carrier family 39 (zinc transporter), member 1/2/3
MSRRISPLHTKGVLTLAIFVLAESVTFSKAVSFWSKFQKIDDRFFQQQEQQNTNTFFARQASEECAAVQTPHARNNNKFNIFARNRPSTRRTGVHQWSNEADYCCRECPGCMESAESIARLCRGGHLHGAAATAVGATTPYNIPLNVWKILFQVFLTALNVACWLIPLKSKRISENKLALSLANAFSGGVFLSLAFGHLIPECLHGFDSTYNEATPFLFVLAGYLLIFFVEKVAFDAHDIMHELEHAHDHVDDAGHGKVSTANANGGSTAPASGRSAVILLGALAVHSVLEMMALGLADSFPDCALLTLSISLHQPAESIALLVAFLKSGLSESQVIRFLSIFSCMGPVGVLLGMLVNQYAAPIVDSIMLAVVAGTFVYVGAMALVCGTIWSVFLTNRTHFISRFAILPMLRFPSSFSRFALFLNIRLISPNAVTLRCTWERWL